MSTPAERRDPEPAHSEVQLEMERIIRRYGVTDPEAFALRQDLHRFRAVCVRAIDLRGAGPEPTATEKQLEAKAAFGALRGGGPAREDDARLAANLILESGRAADPRIPADFHAVDVRSEAVKQPRDFFAAASVSRELTNAEVIAVLAEYWASRRALSSGLPAPEEIP